MPGQLECPMSGTNIDADLLYYSRGENNSSYRPVLTGDVYENLLLLGSTGTERNRTVIILQHPCSMRTNGVDLVWHILAAEVTKHKPLTPQEWAGGNFGFVEGRHREGVGHGQGVHGPQLHCHRRRRRRWRVVPRGHPARHL